MPRNMAYDRNTQHDLDVLVLPAAGQPRNDLGEVFGRAEEFTGGASAVFGDAGCNHDRVVRRSVHNPRNNRVVVGNLAKWPCPDEPPLHILRVLAIADQIGVVCTVFDECESERPCGAARPLIVECRNQDRCVLAKVRECYGSFAPNVVRLSKSIEKGCETSHADRIAQCNVAVPEDHQILLWNHSLVGAGYGGLQGIERLDGILRHSGFEVVSHRLPEAKEDGTRRLENGTPEMAQVRALQSRLG